MSGHNKWSQIKRKKGMTDAKKSKVFSKLVRLIQLEAKKSGGIETPGLRAAMDKARVENMPKDNIDRAIKKASEMKGDMQTQVYEGYGPGGVGMVIVAMTDNANRTMPEIRTLLEKNGATFGVQGSVTWNFSRDIATGDWSPHTTLDMLDEDMEKLATLVEILEDHDDVQEIYTNAG
jgi:YebC/PmpR family DNA-binding regulatory protein